MCHASHCFTNFYGASYKLLRFRDGKLLGRMSSMTNWAKPIAAVVMGLAK
jgi:hypothetical protein